METSLDILKGVHPGFVLERLLKKRGLTKGQFALSVHEYPQTLSAVMGGKRSMNTALALRIEKELGLEEGYFMTLQVFYDIKQEKKKMSAKHQPELAKLRPALFWDTKMEHIDWAAQKNAVIARVFERGNMREKKEILRFYGQETVRQVLDSAKAA